MYWWPRQYCSCPFIPGPHRMTGTW
jgi:hypothetical protein